jgi:hypothetical protein
VRGGYRYLLAGWFLHCLLTDVRYHAGPPATYLHATCLGLIILWVGLDDWRSRRGQ